MNFEKITKENQLWIQEVPTGKQIQTIRKKLKLTQMQFGKLLGVTKLCIARWEIGERQCKGTAMVLINVLTRYKLWENVYCESIDE